MSEKDCRKKMTQRLQFLARKLVEDMESDRHIFIYRDWQGTFSGMDTIHEKLRVFGNCTLLWVVKSSDGEIPGSVRVVRDGLLVGYVARFGNYEGDVRMPIDYDGWWNLCATAYRLWRPDGAETVAGC